MGCVRVSLVIGAGGAGLVKVSYRLGPGELGSRACYLSLYESALVPMSCVYLMEILALMGEGCGLGSFCIR